MGQPWSSEEEVPLVKEAVGSLLYDVMLEGDAVPDLRVVHPLLLLTHHHNHEDSQDRLKQQLQQLQGDIGNRAPTYLKDLIGRLSSFSDEPRLAGLVGLAVTMVMDLVYSSSKQPAGGKGKAAGSSSSQQRVWELQELMEEYLKRIRISLYDKSKLIQDSVRLETQTSFTLTQLKTCLMGGDCNSRSLRHWACGAAFHTQMLLHLSGLECKAEPLSARAALQQYKEDLSQIIPVYRRYKSSTVCVVKCRGSLRSTSPELPEEGEMTGLTVTDRETGKSVTIPLSRMETEIESRRRNSGSGSSSVKTSSPNMDLITSDQFAEAYLDHLFSDKGPVAQLQTYFTRASESLGTPRTAPGCKSETTIGQTDAVPRKSQAEGINEEQIVDAGQMERREGREEAEKLSIVETQPEESLTHCATAAIP